MPWGDSEGTLTGRVGGKEPAERWGEEGKEVEAEGEAKERREAGLGSAMGGPVGAGAEGAK